MRAEAQPRFPLPSTIAFSGRTIGAAYRFGALTIKAAYTNYKVSGSLDSRGYDGGFSCLVTPALNIDAGVWYASDGDNTTNRSILAGLGTLLLVQTDGFIRAGRLRQQSRQDGHGAVDQRRVT